MQHVPLEPRREERKNLTESYKLTDHVRLKSVGDHLDGSTEVGGGTVTLFQAKGEAHPLEHLNVIVNLKRVVKVEQVFGSVGQVKKIGGLLADAPNDTIYSSLLLADAKNYSQLLVDAPNDTIYRSCF